MMSSFSGYKTTAFKEAQKFFVLDPATGSPSFILGSDLVSYIAPQLNYVRSDSTRLSAENTDYDVGTLVQTSGATSPGDGFASIYLVVEGGTGDFPMLNGNDLLVVAGDDALRGQLAASPSTGEGANLVNGATIYVSDVEELISQPSPVDGLRYEVTGYHPDSRVGGGGFYWDSARSKTEHTGGSIIDPGKAWPDWSIDSEVESWFTPAGPGSGCYVRILDDNQVTPDDYGAISSPGRTSDSWRAFEAAFNDASSSGYKLTGTKGLYYYIVALNQLLSSADGFTIDLSGATLDVERDQHDAVSSRIFRFTGRAQDIRLGDVFVRQGGSLTTDNASVNRFFDLAGTDGKYLASRVEGGITVGAVDGSRNVYTVLDSVCTVINRTHVVLTGDDCWVVGTKGSGTSNAGIVNNGGQRCIVWRNEMEGSDEVLFDDFATVGSKWIENYGHDNAAALPLMRIGQAGVLASLDFTVEGNTLETSLGAGLVVQGDNTTNGGVASSDHTGVIRENNVSGCTVAIDVLRCSALVEGNTLKDNNVSVRLRDGASRSRILGNWSYRAATTGYLVDTTSGAIIERSIHFEDNNSIDDAIAFSIENMRWGSLIRNTIRATAGGIVTDGILLSNANVRYLTIDGNMIDTNVTTPLTDNGSENIYRDNWDETGNNKTRVTGEAVIADTDTTVDVAPSLWAAPKVVLTTSEDPAQPVGYVRGTLSATVLELVRSGTSGALNVMYTAHI